MDKPLLTDEEQDKYELEDVSNFYDPHRPLWDIEGLLKAQHTKSIKWVMAEVGRIIDNYMKDGHYKVDWDGVEIQCIGGDMEYVWKQIKEELQYLIVLHLGFDEMLA